MTSSTLFIGILPLLIFVIVESFLGLKAGLIAAGLLALAEAGYSWYAFGELDSVTLGSVVLVTLFAAASWKAKSHKLFYFQPVILGVGTGLYLLGSYLFGKPLLLEFAIKYQHLLPEPQRQYLEFDTFREFLREASMTSGILLIVHAGAVAYAALRMSKWWWISIRAFGFYLALFLSMLWARWIVF